MSGPIAHTGATAPTGPPAGGAAGAARPRTGRYSLLTTRDKVTLSLMVGIPTFLCLFFIWGPTLASFGLSFTNWRGIGAITGDNVVGLKNYETLFTQYALFWPAVWHNILWLLVLTFIATPIGIFFAVLLDKNIRGTRIYQSAIYLPVVLSLAVIGIIWTLQYAPEQGFINGKYAMILTGPWNLKRFEGIDFDVSLVPADPAGTSSNVGGSNMVVFRSSEHADVALDFLRWFTSRDTQLR